MWVATSVIFIIVKLILIFSTVGWSKLFKLFSAKLSILTKWAPLVHFGLPLHFCSSLLSIPPSSLVDHVSFLTPAKWTLLPPGFTVWFKHVGLWHICMWVSGKPFGSSYKSVLDSYRRGWYVKIAWEIRFILGVGVCVFDFLLFPSVSLTVRKDVSVVQLGKETAVFISF